MRNVFADSIEPILRAGQATRWEDTFVIDEVPDLSPVDDGSPASEYGQQSYSIVPQDLAHFGVAEDIYGATVQLPPTPTHDLLEKGVAETLFPAVSAACTETL